MKPTALALTLTSYLIASSAMAQSVSLSESLNTTRAKAEIPGMVVFYGKDSKIAESAASGVRKNIAPDLITTNDKLHIGSITKSMTATILATLIDEGRLSWKSTLSELYPTVNVHPKLKDITLELLLTHRSGMDGGLGRFSDELDRMYETNKPTTAAQHRAGIAGVVLKHAPEIEPNTKFRYSNLGYLLVGQILEKVSGKSWEELIQERLFAPLDMKTCGLGFPGADQPWGHSYNKTGELIATDSDNHPIWGPAGTVHCSIEDLNKYFTFHLNGFNGQITLLKKENFEKLHTSYLDNYTYGGWYRFERLWAGGPVLMHSGTNLKNMAYVWMAPKKNLSLFGFANMGGDEKDAKGDKGSDKSFKAIDTMIGSMIDLSKKIP